MNYDSINSAKRLPIVFCIDVSPSMDSKVAGARYSRMDIANNAIRIVVDELRKNQETWAAAEIAVVTFTEKIIRNDIEFQQISSFSVPSLTTVSPGGTNLANAIMTSIDKIQALKDEYIEKEIPFFLPFLVIITDGNTDHNEDPQKLEAAIKRVNDHCVSHGDGYNIIIPYVIGVGNDIEIDTLDRLEENFIKKAIVIDDNMMKSEPDIITEFLKLIGSSITGSVDLRLDDIKGGIGPIGEDTGYAIEEIKRKRKIL